MLLTASCGAPGRDGVPDRARVSFAWDTQGLRHQGLSSAGQWCGAVPHRGHSSFSGWVLAGGQGGRLSVCGHVRAGVVSSCPARPCSAQPAVLCPLYRPGNWDSWMSDEFLSLGILARLAGPGLLPRRRCTGAALSGGMGPARVGCPSHNLLPTAGSPGSHPFTLNHSSAWT